jgi:V/A-type H+/Na+-transporting ATPase subunit B
MAWEAPVEHLDVASIDGPLLAVRNAEGVGWDEFVEVRMEGGEVRHGVVLEVDRDLAIVEVLEGTSGISPTGSRVVFTGAPLSLPMGPAWLGRVCNGRGEAIDGGPPVVGKQRVAINGPPINPAQRVMPKDPVFTGISVIDGMATLACGQKLPIFSSGGLPHLELAAQIASQARVNGGEFAVVFAAIGLSHADASAIRDVLEERSERGELALIVNTADDPVLERITAPRVALSIAEYLAFTEGRHVLVLMADMTSYADALREVSAARGEVPGRRGYPGYLYSDLASLYERCGRIRGLEGSITQIPVLSMPAGDITHPVPDLTGYITEGQIMLSAEIAARGADPPFEPLASLSRLMRRAAGAEQTRSDHLDVSAQLYAALARARQVRELAELMGAGALSETDRCYLSFDDRFEREFVRQGRRENRSIEQTLDLAWSALAELPRRELTMIAGDQLELRYASPAKSGEG